MIIQLLISVSVLAEQCYTVNSNRMVDIVEWFMTEASICGIGTANINRWLDFKGGFVSKKCLAQVVVFICI